MKNVIILYFTKTSITSPIFKNMTPDNSGIWKDINIVNDPSKADYYVIFEDLYSNFKHPLDFSKTILFQVEPNYVRREKSKLRGQGKANHLQFIYERDDIKFLKKYTYENNQHPVIWVSSISFNDMVNMKYNKRDKNLSCLMANTGSLPEHNIRLNFLKRYAEKYPDSIEIYGYKMPTEYPYKGELKEENNISNNRSHRSSVKVYRDYNYSFVAEGYAEKGQACNKLYDCILNYCMPIYYGDPRVYEYLPKDALYTIDLEKDSIERFYEIANRKIMQKNIDAMTEARKIILNKLNVLEVIYQTIKEKESL
jgi:hypothetical protein